MTATQSSHNEVIQRLRETHNEWPYSSDRDTADGDPWPIAWDAAAFTEYWFDHPDHNDVEEAICNVPLSPENIGYDVAEWHYQVPAEALLRAHLLRIVRGWEHETKLVDYLDNKPQLVGDLGFDNDSGNECRNSPPAKSTLWRVWNNNRISDRHKQVIRTIGQIIVNVAREHDIPAPDEVFHPDPSVDAPDTVEQDDETVRDRTITKTQEVWQQAKPLITDNYHIPRGENTEIHDNAFLEGHAYIGSRAEMYAEDGTRNFAAETTRESVQTGSTHRYHLQKIAPEQAREMHRETTKDLIRKAQRDGELTDGVNTAIDITKSNPYRETTELEFDEDGLANKWLLGYKEPDDDPDALPDLHFQWASIQIVGLDIPLVLDAIPVHRGMKRADIVDELLDKATEMVDIELVMMDREFAHDQVKAVCEDHGVWYLNPGKMHTSERAQCTRLRRQEKLVHIEEDTPAEERKSEQRSLTDFGVISDNIDNEPTRKRVYVPAMNADRTSDTEDDETDILDSDAEDEADNDTVRQELLSEFADATDADIESVGRMFGDVIEEIREEEANRELPGNDKDVQLYILFETNYPDIELPDRNEKEELSEAEKIHMVSRVVRKYSHRWAIENGYKKIKSFRVRTTSMMYEYRFFNFLYACTMYNAWRLVDLLVKLELRAESDFAYEPLVTANLFLTIAKDYNIVGLDPPD